MESTHLGLRENFDNRNPGVLSERINCSIREKRSDYLPSPDHLSTAKTLQVAKPNRLTEIRVLPLELQIGDGISDEAGEWEVIGRPFTTAAGKNAHARVRRVGQPKVTDLKTWGAHERVSVKRASAEEDKR